MPWKTPRAITKSWFTIDEECPPTISLNCVVTIRINSISLSSRRRDHKEVLSSGTTILVISNKEMKDIINTEKSNEDSRMLLKEVTKTFC